MTTLTVRGVQDWLYQNRTKNAYAFNAAQIATAFKATPAEVALICDGAARTGALARVWSGNGWYYTHPTVGMESDIAHKQMRALEKGNKVTHVGGHLEWATAKEG